MKKRKSVSASELEEAESDANRGLAIHFLIVLVFMFIGKYIIYIVFHGKRNYFKENKNQCKVQSVFFYIFDLSTVFCVTHITWLYYKSTVSQEYKKTRFHQLLIGHIFISGIPIISAILPLSSGVILIQKYYAKLLLLLTKIRCLQILI